MFLACIRSIDTDAFVTTTTAMAVASKVLFEQKNEEAANICLQHYLLSKLLFRDLLSTAFKNISRLIKFF